MIRLLGLALALGMMGCGSSDDDGEKGEQREPVCEVGRVAECPCLDGAMGTQTCDDDGGGWGERECAADQPGAKPPVEYKADDVCVKSNLDVMTCGKASGVRLFESCDVPKDGVLVGCMPITGGYCCF